MRSFFVLFIKVIAYEVYRVCCLLTSMWNDILYQTTNKKSHSSLKTAKYGRILFRYKLSLNEIARSDFLNVCTARVRPDYVLKPNVSLYMLTNKEAIFVEVPENVNTRSIFLCGAVSVRKGSYSDVYWGFCHPVQSNRRSESSCNLGVQHGSMWWNYAVSNIRIRAWDIGHS